MTLGFVHLIGVAAFGRVSGVATGTPLEPPPLEREPPDERRSLEPEATARTRAAGRTPGRSC